MGIEKERLLEIIDTLIDNHLEGGDPSWVRELLRDECGITKEEAQELGLWWIYESDL